jgi:hypothetical protein
VGYAFFTIVKTPGGVWEILLRFLAEEVSIIKALIPANAKIITLEPAVADAGSPSVQNTCRSIQQILNMKTGALSSARFSSRFVPKYR